METTLVTPIGKLGITCENEHVVGIRFLPQNTPSILPERSIAKAAHEQIEAYFRDPTFSFSLPLHLEVSQKYSEILRALLTIPLGETKRYGEIALLANTSPRVVGNACRCNPIPIIIPCHRVVSQKSLGGYFGRTDGNNIEIKRKLLHHEGFL